ncbi:MAG: hypothetical protein ACI93L_003433 [Cyclobacteriaceae bacterium]|jgi:hypothetical protein
MSNKVEHLKSQLFSRDTELIKSATSQLFGEGEADLLVGLLEHEDSSIRNAIALTFMENEFQEAIEAIFAVIKQAQNRNARGTLVYALRSLDCSKKLVELFEILFSSSPNWEVQNRILTILEEQEFDFTKDELRQIQSMWEELKDHWNALNGIEESNPSKFQISEDIVNDTVKGFTTYLKS